MLKPKIKKFAVFLMLLHVFLMDAEYTNADIFAERIVKYNKFSSINLDFSTRNSFNNGVISSIFHSLGIQPGGFDLGVARVKAETEPGFKYRLKAVMTNGDDSLCEKLKFKVFDRKFYEVFSGGLRDLDITAKSDSTPNDFIFFAGLDDHGQELQNKICEFNFDFKTYRDNPDEQGGIFAMRLINNVISSGSWQ